MLFFLYAIAGLVFSTSASERQGIESLIAQLGDEAVEVRHNASKRLAQIGAPAVPALVGVLPEADRKLALSIVETLTLMGSDAEAAIPTLIEAFRKPNFSVYRREVFGMFVEFHNSCIEALAAIGSPAVRPLVEALNDVNEHTRSHAASALGWLGSEAQEAVPALIQLLKDKDDGVRQAAASALGRMAQPTGANIADIMLTPIEDLLTLRRQPALSQTDHPAQAAVPTLIEMLGDEDENDSVRVAAAGTLGNIGDVTAVPVLITSLNDRNDRVRSAAASALRTIGPPRQCCCSHTDKHIKKRSIRNAKCSSVGCARIGRNWHS